MTLSVLTPREASIFACLTDTIVAPEPMLPAVRDTDAVEAFDRWLEAAPRLNRLGLRALLYAAEISPRLLGFHGRLRTLAAPDRAAALERAGGADPAAVRALLKLAKSLSFISYYGDDGVMGRLGYDADRVVDRARGLRISERRP